MARYQAGVKTTAGSLTLPVISLYAVAGSSGTLRQLAIFNTTSTAVELKLMRLTTAGTQGAGLTESKHNPSSPAAACTAFTTHSADPTLGDDLGYRWVLGAAVGAGVIETFGDTGLMIPVGATNGIGVVVAAGTGQPCQAYLVWDE